MLKGWQNALYRELQLQKVAAIEWRDKILAKNCLLDLMIDQN